MGDQSSLSVSPECQSAGAVQDVHDPCAPLFLTYNPWKVWIRPLLWEYRPKVDKADVELWGGYKITKGGAHTLNTLAI